MMSGCECKPDAERKRDSALPQGRAQPSIKGDKRMSNRFILSLLAVVLFAGFAGLVHAHGDPIVGTVTAVTADTFTIKDKDNKPVTIMLEKTTKYLMNDKPAKKTDLKVGYRVVIDAEMNAKMKMYSAEEVTIGTAPATPPKK